MAALRNLAISLHRLTGATNIAPRSAITPATPDAQSDWHGRNARTPQNQPPLAGLTVTSQRRSSW